MLPIRIKACSESDLRMLGDLARNIQRVLPVTQADIDAAAALGKEWVVWKVIEVTDPLDNLRGGTQLVIKQNSILPGQNVRRVLIVSGPGGQMVVVGPDESPLLLPDAIADSLQYVKAYGGTEQRNLPDNYIERQFIYMMDGSYLLTDIVPTSDMRIEADVGLLSTVTGAVFGTRNSGGVDDGFYFAVISGNYFVIDGFSVRHTFSQTASANTRYKFIWSNNIGSVYQGSTLVDSHTFTPTQTMTYPMVINGINNAGAMPTSSHGMYVYGFRVWNAQGEMVADYVPAVQKGTVPVVGFYDTVSKTFKTATAGSFTAGADVVPSPDTPMDIVCNNGAIKVSPNLYNLATRTDGYYIGADGTIAQGSRTFCYSALIPVKPNTNYILSGTAGQTDNRRLHAYDSSGNWISQVSFANTTVGNTYNIIGTTPNNCAYVRISIPMLDTNVQVEQGSTATSYIPYGEIYTDGTVETINVHGKNLYDTSSTWNVNASIYRNVDPISLSFPYSIGENRYTYFFKCKPSTKYTVSATTAGDRLFIGGLTSIINPLDYTTSNPFTFDSVIYTATENIPLTYTFTTGANDKMIGIYYALNTIPQNLMIEEGETATTYEPYYNGGTATAEMLLKVGDYQDVQSILDGVVTRNVGVKVLDGTENWETTAQSTVYRWFSPVSFSLPNIGICSHYVGVTSNKPIAEMPDMSAKTGSSTASYLYIKDSSYSNNLSGFKQYLADQYAAGTPVIIVYPLDEPTTESVTGQTLQVQAGDNTLEITQASLSGLELEAEYTKAE